MNEVSLPSMLLKMLERREEPQEDQRNFQAEANRLRRFFELTSNPSSFHKGQVVRLKPELETMSPFQVPRAGQPVIVLETDLQSFNFRSIDQHKSYQRVDMMVAVCEKVRDGDELAVMTMFVNSAFFEPFPDQ